MTRKIFVFGDSMLDIYWLGDVKRISPEGPIPVVDEIKTSEFLGGAANLATNLASIIGNVTLVWPLRESDHSYLKELNLNKINGLEICFVPSSKPLTKKIRIGNENQNLLRIDFEDKKYCEVAEQTQLNYVEQNVRYGDVVCLSDYGKGALSDTKLFIDTVKSVGGAIFVDPKSSQWEVYKGCDLIKPNRSEFKSAFGFDVQEVKSDLIFDRLRALQIGKMVVTLGAEGSKLFDSEKNMVITEQATPKEVVDVSGAGDTFLAGLVYGTILHKGDGECLKIASEAATSAVSHRGTYVVNKHDLHKLRSNISKITNNISSIKQQAAGKKLVFTNGCFDILHAGHVNYLQKARQLGDILVVGLNSDMSVRRLKGSKRPVNNQLHRANVLEALECIDYIVVFDEDDPLSLIKQVKPSIIVKGSDYTEHEVVGADFVKSYGGEVVLMPFIDELSTTKLLQKYREDYNK